MSTINGVNNLWPNFARMPPVGGDVEMMVRGEGSTVYDRAGKPYFDGLSSLYCVNVGHGRTQIADAMAEQAKEIAFYPAWGRGTPSTFEFASEIAKLAPEGLDRIFFTGGGSESVDAAWKLARQYHKLRGNLKKTKIVAREGAYHGTTLGALSVTGIPALREVFEPLVPGSVHVPAVNALHADTSPEEHSRERAMSVARAIEREGPETVAAIIIEPIQNAGGCLVAEPEYFSILRETADEHDVLLISDETICSWGRVASYFGCEVYGYSPDIITTAKGLTSAYAPMGALIASSKVTEPFSDSDAYFNHGLTFGGHPVSAAAGVANLKILHDENLVERAEVVGAYFRSRLRDLLELPVVSEVRGRALFQAVELTRNAESREPFSSEDLTVLTEFIPQAMYDSGLICRAMNRRGPVIQFAPPLISTEQELDFAVDVTRDVLERAMALIGC